MVCYGFKGGIGTASRVLSSELGGYVVGVLVQCNCGRRPQLTIAGVPVGRAIPDSVPYAANRPLTPGSEEQGDVGSIIIEDCSPEAYAKDMPMLTFVYPTKYVWQYVSAVGTEGGQDYKYPAYAEAGIPMPARRFMPVRIGNV